MINFMKLLRKISLLWNEPTLPFIQQRLAENFEVVWKRVLENLENLLQFVWRFKDQNMVSYHLQYQLLFSPS